MEDMENVESAAPATQASVEVPSIGSDLAVVKDLAGGNSAVTVILALIVAAGGKYGWGFWNKRQKLKHEVEMKKLELEAQIKLAEIEHEKEG
jgi:hypothetical protein